jgi:hypothetical protein
MAQKPWVLFQVLTAASMKITTFCDIASCSLIVLVPLMMVAMSTSETSVYFYVPKSYHPPYWKAQLVKKFHAVMEPVCSLPSSQLSVTGLYAEPDKSNPHLQHYIPKFQFNIFLSFTRRSSEWSLLFRFSDQYSVRISHFSLARYIALAFLHWSLCTFIKNTHLLLQSLSHYHAGKSWYADSRLAGQ